MSDPMAALNDMIARLKKMGGPTMAARVAQVATPLVDAAVKETVKNGTDPLGKAWQPKKDGGKPLVNAADHITTKPLDNYIKVTLTGPDVFHHRGTNHMPRRQIIPDGASVPPSVYKALKSAARQVFDELAKK